MGAADPAYRKRQTGRWRSTMESSTGCQPTSRSFDRAAVGDRRCLPWRSWSICARVVRRDPAGAMFGPLVLVNGGGLQFNSFKRWGDYSALIDPTDDCTLPSGTRRSTTQSPGVSTGQHGSVHLSSIAARDEASNARSPRPIYKLGTYVVFGQPEFHGGAAVAPLRHSMC